MKNTTTEQIGFKDALLNGYNHIGPGRFWASIIGAIGLAVLGGWLAHSVFWWVVLGIFAVCFPIWLVWDSGKHPQKVHKS